MGLFEYQRSSLELNMFKSMDIETLEKSGVDMAELEKAMARDGLTQKEVQVTKDGKTFTRKQWVKTGDDSKGSGNMSADDHKKAAADIIHRIVGKDDKAQFTQASADDHKKLQHHLDEAGVKGKSNRRFEHGGQKFTVDKTSGVARQGAHPDHKGDKTPVSDKAKGSASASNDDKPLMHSDRVPKSNEPGGARDHEHTLRNLDKHGSVHVAGSVLNDLKEHAKKKGIQLNSKPSGAGMHKVTKA
jgi:hypothetical protein